MPVPNSRYIQQVVTVYDTYFAGGHVALHWSNTIDKLVLMIASGDVIAYRTSRSPDWQPVLVTTTMRMIQNLMAFENFWVELQNPDHEIVRFGPDLDLAFQVFAECSLLALGQSKPRVSGQFRSKPRDILNNMKIRIPHR